MGEAQPTTSNLHVEGPIHVPRLLNQEGYRHNGDDPEAQRIASRSVDRGPDRHTDEGKACGAKAGANR